jgi:hypothetical protein
LKIVFLNGASTGWIVKKQVGDQMIFGRDYLEYRWAEGMSASDAVDGSSTGTYVP